MLDAGGWRSVLAGSYDSGTDIIDCMSRYVPAGPVVVPSPSLHVDALIIDALVLAARIGIAGNF